MVDIETYNLALGGKQVIKEINGKLEILKNQNAPYTYINMTDSEDVVIGPVLYPIVQYYKHGTVPVIFEVKFIGGCNDLKRLKL